MSGKPKIIQTDTEPYIRSDDGARMVAQSPGNYVNAAVR